MLNKLFSISVLALGAILVVGSCTKDSDALRITKSGYEFKVCADHSGEPVQTGEFAFFDLTIRSGDSLLQTSHDESVPVAVKIDAGNQMYGKFAPVIDMIRTMSEGDSCILYFPKDSFATNNPAMASLADVLTYEVALKEIKSEEEYKAYQDSLNEIRRLEIATVQAREAEVATFVQDHFMKYNSNALSDVLLTTESGLEYIIHEQGEQSKLIESGDFVEVHYYGALKSDNTMFDNSFKKGEPIKFTVGRGEVISGWDEGLQLMRKGSKATFFIPFELAYGKAGRDPMIPEEADLIFYVEIVNVVDR